MIERLFALYRLSSSGLAAVALVVANLVPLVGVVLWRWDLATILVLYWVENGIVGVFTVPRILLASGTLEATVLGHAAPPPSGPASQRRRALPAGFNRLQKAALVPFFAMHYGIFWVVHGVFVFAIAGGLFTPGMPGDLDGPAPDLVILGAIGLVTSHGISFALNYVGRREYATTSPSAQMGAPYARVVILHLTIILGAIGVEIVGSPVAALAVLVVAKTIVDLGAHLLEHARASERAGPEPAVHAAEEGRPATLEP